MSDNIKLLEELVVEAVGRLRELTREREELREEIASLQERLDALQREVPAVETDGGERETWEDRRVRALEVVRLALSELRGEGNAA